MNIVRAFISVDGLEVYHVAHDLVLFRNSIRSVHVPREARDIESLPAVVTLYEGDHFRSDLALVEQATHAQ